MLVSTEEIVRFTPSDSGTGVKPKHLYTLVYNMGTKMVRIDEDVYEHIEAHKRDDETFSETIERLVGGPSLLSLQGILSEAEAAQFREAIEEASEASREEGDELVERFDDA